LRRTIEDLADYDRARIGVDQNLHAGCPPASVGLRKYTLFPLYLS